MNQHLKNARNENAGNLQTENNDAFRSTLREHFKKIYPGMSIVKQVSRRVELTRWRSDRTCSVY